MNVFPTANELAIAMCEELHRTNHCVDHPAPFLEAQCLEWLRCSRQDPRLYNRLALASRYLTEIVQAALDNLPIMGLVSAIVSHLATKD